MNWNVLCPGPSLHRVEDKDFLAGPVVAVNAAITTQVPVDVWCCHEGKAFEHYLEEFRGDIERHLPLMWVDGPFRCELPKWATALPFEARTLFRRHFGWFDIFTLPKLETVWGAIARCMEEGATSVTLYGHDMRGASDFTAGGEALPNARSEQGWADRWKVMQGLYAEVIAAAAERDVEVRAA